MKRGMINIVLIAAVLLAGGLIYPVKGEARVDVNITIPLPGLGIAAPPAMIVVPGTYAYFAPDIEADLFFYHGYWYLLLPRILVPALSGRVVLLGRIQRTLGPCSDRKRAASADQFAARLSECTSRL